MNQASVEKILRVLNLEKKYMETLALHSAPNDKTYFGGQASGIKFAIKTIEAQIKHE